MLYSNRIDLSEGTDVAKINNSKECMTCHYWCFNRGFKFQDYVRNGCHGLTTLCLNIGDIAIIIVKDVDCRCVIHDISNLQLLF